jgi:hypothetical protein
LRWYCRMYFLPTRFSITSRWTIRKSAVLAAAWEIGVHDFIMTLPDNYDFDVKERGDVVLWSAPTNRFPESICQ